MESSRSLSAKIIVALGLVGLSALGAMLAVAYAAFFSAPTASAQTDSGKTSINQNRVIQKDEVVDGDVNVTNGNLVVYGTIHGNAVVFNGNADIEGGVEGNVAVPVVGNVALGDGATVHGNVLANGNVVLGPNSRVDGDVSAVGGKVVQDPTASIGGKITAPDLSLNGVTNQVITPDPVDSGALPQDEVVSPARRVADRMLALFGQGAAAVALMVMGLILVIVVPNRAKLASATLEAEPGPSMVVGFIAGVLLFPAVGLLGILLTVSVIGLFFIPVLVVAVALALLFGLITIGSSLGRWVLLTTHHVANGSTNALLVQVAAGMAIILGTTVIPSAVQPGVVSLIMGVVLYFTACAGLGAAILSRFGTLAPPKRAPVYFHSPFGLPGHGPAAAGSHFVADPRHAHMPHTPPSPLPVEDPNHHVQK